MAAAGHEQALALFRDLGNRAAGRGMNNLGELQSQTQYSQQARDHHTQALAIARDLGVPLEEARALEGIGRCHLQDGNPGEGPTRLRQALTIHQRIGAAST